MTLQLLEEEEGQAWAIGALLDSVGRSTKPFGRQDLSETGFVATAEPCLSGTQTSELTRLPKRHRSKKKKKTPKNKYLKNKLFSVHRLFHSPKLL